MRRITTIVGARPQFIKAATISRQLRKNDIREEIIHTGQHFDKNMSSVFFEEMDIPTPTYNLDIHSLTHGAMTGRMLEGIEKILIDTSPDGVIVYGDTNSTLAGALAASKLNIPLIHVEAGLRSFNMRMPEEVNRILTDRISSLLLCPTETAVDNLKKEGFSHFDSRIEKIGDVMYDAALYYASRAEQRSDIIQRLKLNSFVLGTIHRQENTDAPNKLKDIISALDLINESIPVIVPLHPRTRKKLADLDVTPSFTIIDPVGYFDMIMLLKNSELVITDSGGVQKEAFFFEKHCITLREETEWTELVDHGYNKLTGSDKEAILSAFEEFREKESDFSTSLYGKGDASEIACQLISEM